MEARLLLLLLKRRYLLRNRTKQGLDRDPMSKKRPGRIYHYRGQVERGARYEWRDGYSASGEGGGGLYPWATRAECRSEAKRDGFKAVFYRDGVPE